MAGQTGGPLDGLVVTEDTAYVGSGAMVTIIDIVDPLAMRRLSNLFVGDEIKDIQLSGSLLFVACNGAGLAIVDVIDPEAPVVRSLLALPGPAQGVDVADGRAYVAVGAAGVCVVDVSAPDSPTLRSTLDTAGTAYDVEKSGTLLVVADGAAGLVVIDATDPDHLVPRGSFDTAGITTEVSVSGSLVAIADGAAWAQLFDVSNPDAPASLSTVRATLVRSVLLRGTTLYFADLFEGLLVADVTNPRLPVVVAGVGDAVTSEMSSVARNSRFVYGFDRQYDFKVLNIFEGAVVDRGTFRFGRPGRYVSFVGDTLVVSGGDDDLGVQAYQPVEKLRNTGRRIA